MAVENQKMILESNDIISGRTKDIVNVKNSHNITFKININSKYLLDILQFMSTDSVDMKIVIRYIDNNSPLILQYVDDNNSKFCVCHYMMM